MGVMTLIDNTLLDKRDVIATLEAFGLNGYADDVDGFMAYAREHSGSESPSLCDVENAAYARAWDLFFG